VLGREDLDGVVERERRADRVGADAGLADQRARREVRRARGVQHPGVPVAPQQHAVGVADDDEVARLRRHRFEQIADLRRHARERMLRETLGDLVGVEHDLGRLVGVDARPRAALPGAHDEVAQDRRRAAAGQDDFVGAAEEASMCDAIAGEVHRNPRTAQLSKLLIGWLRCYI
jgi:hypothetical protein